MQSISQLRKVLQELNSGKVEKRADEQGESSHPTEHADDGTVGITEGSHGGENDEKLDVATNDNNNTNDASPGKTVDDALSNIGVVASTTGEDPTAEKDIGTGPKEQTDTTSKVTADYGEKYSSEGDYEKLANEQVRLGNEILTSIYQANHPQAATRPNDSPESSKLEKAAQDGYDLASVAAGQVTLEELATNLGREVVKDAVTKADLLADFWDNLYKRAAEGPPAGLQAEETAAGADSDTPAPSPDGGGGGEMPMPPDGGAGGEMPPDPAAMGGGEPPPMGGGEPGGMEGGGPEGGEPSREEVIAELVQVMQAMGISPEDLAGAGQTDMAKQAGYDMVKIATDVAAYRLRHGKRLQYGPPKTARQRTIRANMVNFVNDLL